jgi:hypothetical protein
MLKIFIIRTYEKPKVEANFVGWIETQHVFRAVKAAYKSLTKIDFNLRDWGFRES